MKKVSMDFHGRPLSIEVGRLATQADGAAYIQFGDTVVLVTAVSARKGRENMPFFPLSVDYFEKFPAAGKIPGGFFKREGRQTEKEILTSRVTDRPIRPLFPDGYKFETQVICNVLSFDKENEADVLCILGASTALHISDIPFHGPIAGVRVGRVDGNFVCNPTTEQMKTSDMDLMVACSRDAIVMVEGEAKEVPDNEVLDGLMYAFEQAKPLLDLQDELRKAIGKEKRPFESPQPDKDLSEKVLEVAKGRLDETMKIVEKIPRYRRLSEVEDEVVDEMVEKDENLAERTGEIKDAMDTYVKSSIRSKIVDADQRLDGRDVKTIRNITIDVGPLPRTHGSAIFTRGETQALVTTTLGTSDDQQRIDALAGEHKRSFMLHYNFPPFSVGETKPMRGPGRREIGHGTLARKSLEGVLPNPDDFPYTIRVVSDILESHGSSSMATVCGGALALMDAGVPIKAPVAGIAMGLIKEGETFKILSDISGDEDHIGDMDFKVSGTQQGVTAIQMDIKIEGISREILEKALEQAKEGRLHILGHMNKAIESPREKLSEYAPQIETIEVKQDKIREIIGPGGKMIRKIQEESGAKVDIDDSGTVKIASPDKEALNKARELINQIIAEPEEGQTYTGKVNRIEDYGAFVEIMPGHSGLLHVSEIYHEGEGRLDNVTDVMRMGDEVEVKLVSIEGGKYRLSTKAIFDPDYTPPSPRRGGRDRGGRDRGGRDFRGGRGGGRGRDSRRD